ncbi:MAG: tripartite tricarboxylate transporter TctB family protein [Deltaproteobacteria bacterium]|nr:tripartite tricarboxylate transporter TctB family protein [Deltaproteobacteria bacterium]
MRYHEQIGSTFWIVIGLLFCTGAPRYGFFSEGVPEPGLFPFLAGIILVLLGSIVWLQAFKEKSRDKGGEGKFFPQADTWKRIFLSVLALSVYVLILDLLGFLLATFLFLAFLLRFIEPQKWSVVLTAALLTSVSSYLLFQLLLKSNLPKGFLGV